MFIYIDYFNINTYLSKILLMVNNILKYIHVLPLRETLHILLDSKHLFVFIIGYICKCLKSVPHHFLPDG